MAYIPYSMTDIVKKNIPRYSRINGKPITNLIYSPQLIIQVLSKFINDYMIMILDKRIVE